MLVPEEEHLIQPCSSGQQKTKPDTIEFTSGNSKQELTVTKELGRGAFGEVVLATDNRGRPFAVKKVKCTNIQAYQAIAQELEMLLGLSHHNIMKLHAIDFIDFTAIFVMEYCANGTLNKKLDEKILMNTKFKWIQQLASALSYLHKNNIVHRDLKPDNVLLNKDDEIKLADFGIARNFTCMTRGREEYANDPGAYLSEYLDTDMGTFAGTPYWVAPEVFDHSYDEKADIFSLGVIFYAILSHQVFEFEGQKYYGAFVEHYGGKLVGVGLAMSEKGEQLYPEFCEDHNKALVVIIKSMLDYDPVNRKSLDTILVEVNDAFFEHLSSENSTRKNIMASVEDMADAMQHLGYWIACQLCCQRFVESCERCCTRCGRKCSCRRADCEEKAGDDIELQPCCATKF